MVDRIITLNTKAKKKIRKDGFGWFLEDDNDEYLSDDVAVVTKSEVQDYSLAAESCYQMFGEALAHVDKNNLWSRLGISESLVPLIRYDWERQLPHMTGRIDLSGGLDGIGIKLIEFNADTCTIMPESAYFQNWMYEQSKQTGTHTAPFNNLIANLSAAFIALKNKFPEKEANLLLTTLGHIEDRLNMLVIKEAAEAAGFKVKYADLEKVVFAEDGVFLQGFDGYTKYDFMYKLVPWEFCMFEEPELMDILVDLSMNDEVVILNPAYGLAFQAKHMMSILYELFPNSPYLLPTYDNEEPLFGKQYVRKVNFGRMGENIDVVDEIGDLRKRNNGDFGHFTKVYQEFADMFFDEDGDIYQAGMYIVRGKASCLSFRRRDDLIIDDDSEFIGHVIQ